MKKFLLLFLFLIGIAQIIVTPHSSYADNQGSVRELQTITFSGRVIKLNNNIITVQSGNIVKEITVPQRVRVMRNNIETAVTDVRLNDQLQVTQTPSGEVLSLTAFSSDVLLASRLVLPLGILGVLTVLGIVLARMKVHKQLMKPLTINGMT